MKYGKFNLSMSKFFVIVLLSINHTVFCQVDDIKFGNISTEQGLSKVYVQCIFQDSKGFIWVGTKDGLNHYDGYKFTNYIHDPADSTSIIGNDIKGIVEDSKGNLWIATFEGLSVYERSTGRFKNYTQQEGNENSLISERVTSIAIDKDDNIFVTSFNWLSIFKSEEKKFQHMDFKNETGANITLSTVFLDRRNNLWIGTLRDGELYRLDSASRQLKSFDIKYLQDTSKTQIVNNGNLITSFCEDKHGLLWIGSKGNGLYCLDPRTEKFLHYKNDPNDANSIPYNGVLSLMEDHKENLWIGTQNGGLIILNKDRDLFTHYKHDDRDPKSLADNSVYCIYQDKKGTIWLGTQLRGLNFYDEELTKFKHYKHSPFTNSISHDVIKGFAEDKEGNIWISTEGGGLNVFNPITEEFKSYVQNDKNKNSISTNFLLAVYADSKDNIWIGSFKGGLNLLDKSKGTFKVFKNSNDTTSLLNDNVYSIYEDKQGNLWLGTVGGLSLFNPKSQNFTQYPYPTKGFIGFVSISEDKNGILVLGTSSGLITFDTKSRLYLSQLKNDVKNPTSLSNDLVNIAFIDTKSNMWVGTDDGLNLMNKSDSSFRRFNVSDGLPHRCIQSMMEDHNGNLWITTNKGLSLFNTKTYSIKNYDILDGLQHNEFKRTAVLKTFNGEIYFGGINGFNVFHPDNIKDNTFVPPVQLVDFQLFNKSVIVGAKDSPLKQHISVTKEIVLSHEESSFSFEFIALNYVIPQKNQYAYKLEGFDTQWNYVNNQRKASYTNLDPGEYIFKIKGSNNNGIWNKEGTSIRVIITPPAWLTWWFKTLAALFITGILFTIYRIRTGVITAQRKQLEHLVKERTEQLVALTEEERKARQLAEKASMEAEQATRAKSIFLATMSHEIRTPMNGVIGMASLLCETPLNAEQQEYTQTIRSCGESLLGVINDILDYSKIESGKMELERKDFDLRMTIEEVLDVFAGKATEAGLDLIYQMEYNVPAMIIGDSLRLRQVLMNLVGNAVKFTQQGEIFIGVRLLATDGDNVKLGFEVRDTGIGIPEDKLGRLFKAFSQVDSSMTRKYGGTGLGLVICEKIIDLMGGYMEVESEVGKGTTFSFNLTTSVSQQSLRTYVNTNLAGLEGKRVLVIDDNATNRIILQNQLTQWKLAPILATSGKEALTVLKKSSFDLVLTDMQMPEMDGMDLAKAIRKEHPIVPIILLSSIGDDRPKEHPELFSSVLTKPVKQAVLCKHILMQLQQQHQKPIREETIVTKKLHTDFSEKHPLQILIAEDNPVNQKLAERVLTKLGYKPDTVSNGKEVLSILEHNQYDVIFMDVQMPEMDGLEATKRIRILKKEIVIIAMTANAMQGDREICIEAGMDDYISKPIKIDDLVVLIEKWADEIKAFKKVS